MRRSIDRIQAASRARLSRLTAVAAFGLAVLGASALYLIHRTMPAPMQTAAGSSAPGAGGTPAPAVPALAPAPSAAGLAEQGAAGSDTRGRSTDSIVGPLPRPESAPVSLRVPMPSEAGGDGDGAAVDTGAHNARKRRPAAGETARGGSATSTRTELGAAQSSAGGRARSGWGGELEGGLAGSEGAQVPSAGTGGAKTVSSIQASATAPARNAPERLGPLQRTRCADSEFLMKLICDERVRLRFCQSRWNAHPDCIVEARTLTY
jgi:hypothetical protein